jgi:GTP-binding protein
LKVSAEFVTSAIDAAGFPRERLPELALVGRSNVGKSSLINALVRQKVARTSAAPGKTRLANFYRVAAEGLPPFYLVDLPGYGYARGGEASAREFQAITGAYFHRGAGKSQRDRGAGGERPIKKDLPDLPNLPVVFLLVDSRHPGLDSDLGAWRWLASLGIPRGILATKVDKLSRADRTRHLQELERLHDSPVLGVSAQTGEGLNELWQQIEKRLKPKQP